MPLVARFSANSQTSSGPHTASYTVGTGSLSSGVKRPGRGVDHPPPSSVEIKESVELYLYSFLWTCMVCSRMNFSLYLFATR